MVRTVEVDPARLDRWVAGFAARHDGVTRADVPGSFVLTGGDGATATGEPFDHARVGLVLVRRGGHAVGRDEGGDLVAHTCGTAYVQSRTKKGGWSQQRYARRRGNQADGVVGKVADLALRHLPADGVDALVLGGDRRMAEQVLDDDRLAHLRDLPRRVLWDLPDPRLTVLREAARRARAVRITLEDPPAGR
ncbi:acVLRF1 family peptidyl-tRNA hydrolase [Janibacter anophelis]|uniref:acVLRF1 family peptidyl-tRNA hydrolase n=1 Tax=Janibacter anophelis TaxID=319054 RepID=UPI000DEF2AF8|nr:acVLRF1 family peptidyl-tRNA hydrolase [Janibacter anophelis]